jgi:hypothetical protein
MSLNWKGLFVIKLVLWTDQRPRAQLLRHNDKSSPNTTFDSLRATHPFSAGGGVHGATETSSNEL